MLLSTLCLLLERKFSLLPSKLLLRKDLERSVYYMEITSYNSNIILSYHVISHENSTSKLLFFTIIHMILPNWIFFFVFILVQVSSKMQTNEWEKKLIFVSVLSSSVERVLCGVREREMKSEGVGKHWVNSEYAHFESFKYFSIFFLLPAVAAASRRSLSLFNSVNL